MEEQKATIDTQKTQLSKKEEELETKLSQQRMQAKEQHPVELICRVLFFYIDKRCYYSKFAGVYKNKAVVNTATKGTNGRPEILKQYRLGIIFYIPGSQNGYKIQ